MVKVINNFYLFFCYYWYRLEVGMLIWIFFCMMFENILVSLWRFYVVLKKIGVGMKGENCYLGICFYVYV